MGAEWISFSLRSRISLKYLAVIYSFIHSTDENADIATQSPELGKSGWLYSAL